MSRIGNSELSRIKEMMTYGLTTEGKKSYSSVEYSKEGPDSKVYGIVREGTKYYIKVAKDKKNLVKENFDYIGGFSNRKNNEYSSYANALKQFDLKMMSLKEANANGKNIIIESWNPDKQEMLALESTDKMRKEIMRQRQIMGNVVRINEGCECKSGDPFCCDVDKEYKVEGDKNEFKANKVDDKSKDTCAEVNEAAEPLAWHKEGGDAQQNIADTYMDKSHGTKIGNSAPFGDKYQPEEKNGVVEECGSMAIDNGDNQNKPAVGVGEVGDDAPFDGEKGKQLEEAIDDLGDSEMLDDEADADYDAEYEVEGDEEMPMDDEMGEEPVEDEMGGDDLETYDDLGSDEEVEGGDMESRLSSIEETLATILDKLNSLNSAEYEDDDLYDDETEVEDEMGEEPVEDEMPMGDEMGDEEMPMDDEMGEEPMDDDTEVFESKSYRKMRLAEENRLNDFGKHPAYRKTPFTLPKNGEDKNQWGRDWNDESVHGEQPFGQQIGDGAPFEVDPQAIENSIAECVKKILGQLK